MGVQPQLAFCVREVEPPEVEVRVNFGVFAGRGATAAEIDELAQALLPKGGEVSIVAEERHEIGEESEASRNQARIEVAADQPPDDEHELDQPGRRLVEAAESGARGRIAGRHADLSAASAQQRLRR